MKHEPYAPQKVNILDILCPMSLKNPTPHTGQVSIEQKIHELDEQSAPQNNIVYSTITQSITWTCTHCTVTGCAVYCVLLVIFSPTHHVQTDHFIVFVLCMIATWRCRAIPKISGTLCLPWRIQETKQIYPHFQWK